MADLQTQTDVTPYDDGALYDLFFERLDYGLDFYLGLARSKGGPVLDVACGTGRVLLPMLEAGFDVDGVDLFPAMIERLREKAAARAHHRSWTISAGANSRLSAVRILHSRSFSVTMETS